PSTAMRASRSCVASIAQRSGPMPAGSPDVTTIVGRGSVISRPPPAPARRGRAWAPTRFRGRGARVSDLDVDEGLIAQAPQPQLALLFGLVRANLHDAPLALQLVGHIVRAPIRHLDDMPAEARAERLADLADLELRELLLELRHERARADPAEVAAVGRRNRILGDRARDRPELVSCENLLADADQPLLDRVVVHDLVRRQQDVPRAHLILHHPLGAAHLV